MNPPAADIERGRFVQRVIRLLTGLAGGLAVMMLASGNPRGTLAFLVATGAGGGLLLLSRGRALLWAGRGLPSILLGVILWLSIVNGGGLGAPVLMTLPLVPILGFFAGGPWAGAVWLGVALLVPVGFFVAEPWIGEPTLPPDLFLRMHLLASMMACVSISAFAAQYERVARQREASLEQARLAAEAANAAKSRFLAAMSHELRTPLGGILGVTQLLHRSAASAEQAELVGLVDRSAHGLLALLDQILDLSRIEANALALEAVPFCPAEVVEDVVVLHQVAAQRAGLSLSLEVLAGQEAWVLGDPLRLRQIAQNLVGNALKFTMKGAVRVRLAVRPEGTRLEVEDTGIGIPAEVLPRLFEPFRQADEGTARRFGGSGLGLSIVARLVAFMGGSIAVRSEAQSGSCFLIELPLPLTDAPAPSRAEAPAPSTAQGLRVLLVDDNAINRAVFSRMLESLGCAVLLAEDGPTAVALAAQEAPALILMDVNMPGMDGFEATRRVRAEQDVPVVALTASVSESTRAEASAAGMVGFLTKPLAIQALQEALATYARPTETAAGSAVDGAL